MAGRKLRWALGIGAAALVVGIGAVLLPRPGGVPPVPAAPQSPAATSVAPSPSPSASRRENWYRWQRIGDAPIDLNVHPEVAAEHGYYLLGANGSCELTTYFYESASDRWDKLPALGNAKGWCVTGSATKGDDLYLLLGLDSEDEVLAGEPGGAPGLAFRRHNAASGAWEELPGPELGGVEWTGLDRGLLGFRWLRGSDDELVGMGYSYFDYATGSWAEDDISDRSAEVLRAADGFWYQTVQVEGRSLVLFVDWPNLVEGGRMTFTTWDPTTNQRVLQTGSEVSAAVMRSSQQHLEFAEPGFVLVGNDSPGSVETASALVDLRDGTWSSLELPDQRGPIAQQQPSAAHWAKPYFGEALAGYVVANGYLYNPTTQRWFALPWREVSPPAQNDESQSSVAPLGGRIECAWEKPRECWELVTDPLDSILIEVTAEQIAESNAP